MILSVACYRNGADLWPVFAGISCRAHSNNTSCSLFIMYVFPSSGKVVFSVADFQRLFARMDFGELYLSQRSKYSHVSDTANISILNKGCKGCTYSFHGEVDRKLKSRETSDPVTWWTWRTETLILVSGKLLRFRLSLTFALIKDTRGKMRIQARVFVQSHSSRLRYAVVMFPARW